MKSQDIDRTIKALDAAIHEFGDYLTKAIDVLEDLRQHYVRTRKRERYQLRYRRRGTGKKKRRVQ